MGFFAAFIGFLIVMAFFAEGGGLVNQSVVEANLIDGIRGTEQHESSDTRRREILELEEKIEDLETEVERLKRSDS